MDASRALSFIIACLFSWFAADSRSVAHVTQDNMGANSTGKWGFAYVCFILSMALFSDTVYELVASPGCEVIVAQLLDVSDAVSWAVLRG